MRIICWLLGHKPMVTPEGWSRERIRTCPRCATVWFRWRDDGLWREW